MCQAHWGFQGCLKTKKPCYDTDSVFVACKTCRNFWVYENFNKDPAAYSEVSNMIGSFMEGGKVLTASLLPLQNLLLRYAQQYKDYEVSQKALSAKIETLEMSTLIRKVNFVRK